MSRPEKFASPLLITLPDFVRGEAETIAALLKRGARIVHLRKPGADSFRMQALLEALREMGVDFSRLTWHGEESWVERYGFGGWHGKGESFESKCIARKELEALPEPEGFCGSGQTLRLSISTHSWEEAEHWLPFVDYVWLSPLFDSISKKGYRSGIDIRYASRLLLGRHRGREVPLPGLDFSGADAVCAHSSGKVRFPEGPVSSGGIAKSDIPRFPERVVALGGISAGNIARVRMAGFGGAAVLGALWAKSDSTEEIDPAQTVCNFERLNRRWQAAGGTLQLISDGQLAVAQAFLEGGGRWIQLRMKDASSEQIVTRGRELSRLCDRYGAVLLLDDRVDLVGPAGARGVHLGKNDMPVDEARRMLGEGAIIGCTANTWEDIESLNRPEVDYIGLGPFRYTTTKKNLSPILGAEGYRRIMSKMRCKGICLPVVAIGGIEPSDVAAVMRTGVNGVAVSGAIARSADPRETTRDFVELIARYRLGWEEAVDMSEED